MRLSFVFSLLFALALGTPPAGAAARFSGAYQSHQVPFFVYDVVPADLDLDGRLDIAVISTSGVSLLRGQAGGTFQRADTVVVSGSRRGAIGLLDGDAYPDLVVMTTGRTTVFLGNGDFTFQSPVLYTPGGTSGGTGLDLADVDGDGELDFVSADSLNAVRVRPGNGAGGFGPPLAILPTAANARHLAARDLDDDGDVDVAINVGGALVVFLNQGGGAFDAGTTYPLSVPYGGGIAVGDLDGDDLADVVVGSELLRNLGAGAFASWSVLGDSTDTYPALADFDFDGRLDLVTIGSDATFTGYFHSRRGLGNGTFESPLKWLTAHSPSATAIADLDGDGRLDVVAVGSSFGHAAISRGLGPAGFFAPPSYDAGGDPTDVAVADVNGDGDADVLAVSHGLLRMFPGNGDATLGTPVDFASTLGETRLAVGDVNADDIPDVITANGTSASISYYRGTGGGAFASRVDLAVPGTVVDVAIADIGNDGVNEVIALGSGVAVFPGLPGTALGARADYGGIFSPRRLGAARLNGDAYADVVVLDQGGPQLRVFPGQAAGTLGAAASFGLGSGEFFMSMAIVDVDSDTDLDLVAADWVSASFITRRNDGLGNFTAAPSASSSRRTFQVEAADVDLDGDPDLVTANNNAQVASVFLGNGAGAFPLEYGYGPGGFPNSLAVGDLDGDGYPEIVTGDAAEATSPGDGTEGRVTVLQNSNSKTVGVPAPRVANGAGLAIARVWPTVASTRLNVEFVLPQREVVTLELYDVNGRRLARRDLGVLDAGRSRAGLALDRAIPAGVVWVRVRQGGASAAARAVVAR